MRDLLIIFGLIFLAMGVGYFIAWRMEVRERREIREQQKRDGLPAA